MLHCCKFATNHLTISHDIRSPLNVISATVELARREVDNQRRDTYLSNIESVCLHVVHLLNNLLDVYRLNQSKEECNYVPFSLHEMLDRIASRFPVWSTTRDCCSTPRLTIRMSDYVEMWTV